MRFFLMQTASENMQSLKLESLFKWDDEMCVSPFTEELSKIVLSSKNDWKMWRFFFEGGFLKTKPTFEGGILKYRGL